MFLNISVCFSQTCLKTYTQKEFESVRNYDEFFLCNFEKYGSVAHFIAGNIMSASELLKNCSHYKDSSKYFQVVLKNKKKCLKGIKVKLSPGDKINLSENKQDCLKAAKLLTAKFIDQKFNTIMFSESLVVCFPRELEAQSFCCP
jgi:hypothetical protein